MRRVCPPQWHRLLVISSSTARVRGVWRGGQTSLEFVHIYVDIWDCTVAQVSNERAACACKYFSRAKHFLSHNFGRPVRPRKGLVGDDPLATTNALDTFIGSTKPRAFLLEYQPDPPKIFQFAPRWGAFAIIVDLFDIPLALQHDC